MTAFRFGSLGGFRFSLLLLPFIDHLGRLLQRFDEALHIGPEPFMRKSNGIAPGEQ